MALLTRRIAIAVSVALLGTADAPLAAQRSLEYEVKAAFLYNIVRFTDWPAESLGAAAEPFRVCVFGSNPFGSSLDRTVSGDTVEGHAMTVERIAGADRVPSCRVLFVPQSEAGRALPILRAAEAVPVLTVGEAPHFLDQGGIVNLVIEGGRVRFDVNAAAAAARGLRISSKLLRIARNSSGDRTLR